MAYTYKYKETEEQRRARMAAFMERRGKNMESTDNQTCTALDMAPGKEASVKYDQKFVRSPISPNHAGKTNTKAEPVPAREIMGQVFK